MGKTLKKSNETKATGYGHVLTALSAGRQNSPDWPGIFAEPEPIDFGELFPDDEFGEI